MNTRIPRLGRARAFSLAALIALLAMLLPAAAGVALAHNASGSCDRITLTNSTLNASIYVHGSVHNSSTLVMTVPGDNTYTIAPGSYDVVWTDKYEVDAVSVGKCSPTVKTVASPSTGTAGVAMTVGDTATLQGAVTFAAGSSVTFTLYSDNKCTTSTGVIGSGTLNGSGVATYSTSWTPSAIGTYYWKVSFPGDTYNNGVSACGGASETLMVGPNTPSVTTQLSETSPVAIGTTVHDSATINNATG
ncbi:MAG: hypothetical protein ABSA21_01035, partial [Candidatus Limnocylindrales bacterium]